MVTALVRNVGMPPERWMVQIPPSRESLGEMLRRLRLARGWSQKELQRLTGIDQGRLSNYERNLNIPDPDVIDALNALYELPPDTLSAKAWEESRYRRLPPPEPVPGPSVAIPQEPELIEAVKALFLLESDELAHWAELIRLQASEQQKPKRPERGQAAS